MQRCDQHQSRFFPLVLATALSTGNIGPFRVAVQGNWPDFCPTYIDRWWLLPHQNVKIPYKWLALCCQG